MRISWSKIALRTGLIALLSGASVLNPHIGYAQDSSGDRSSPAWGTPGARRTGLSSNLPSPSIAADRNQTPSSRDLGRIGPTNVYRHASVSLGGVGLRNRGGGGIDISGGSGEVKAAFVYWAVITEGEPTRAVSGIDMRRDFPAPASDYRTVSGTVVGRGPSPCWLGDRITVFRGSVPTRLAQGNGHYTVRLRSGGNGLTDGADPWVASPLPLFEGASLVIIRGGNRTVALYERGLAGQSFSSNLRYELGLPRSVTDGTKVFFHSIGADGQSGVSTAPVSSTASEVTRLGPRGPRIAGPGSRASDGQWNGALAGPLPQLWDTTTHEITAEVGKASVSTTLPINVSAPFDCLTPVANLVEID